MLKFSEWIDRQWSLARILLAASIGLVVVSFAALMHHTNGWSRVRVPAGELTFIDLRMLTTAAACRRENDLWPRASLECTIWPETFVYNYPLLWAQIFDTLGLDNSVVEPLGLILVAIYGLCCTVLLWLTLDRNKWVTQSLVALVIFLSPPALLLVERGNVDVLMFALLTLSIALYASHLRSASALTLAIGFTAKIFPVGAALMLFTDRARLKRTLLVFTASLTVSFALIIPDLPTILSKTPVQPGDSFGMSVIPLWIIYKFDFPVDWSGPIPRVAGSFIFLVAFGLVVVAIRRFPGNRILVHLRSTVSELTSDRTAAILFLAGSGTFLAAYLVGASWDYRLVFVTPAILGLSRLTDRSSKLVCAVLAVGMYLSIGMPGSVQGAWDVVMLLVAPFLTWMTIALIYVRIKPAIG